MTIKDAISATSTQGRPACTVSARTPLLEALPSLLDTPDRLLGVEEMGDIVGVVTEVSLLEALGRLIAPRDDSSVITVECPPADYSASMLAHAVEDAGAHLVDLISGPAPDGNIRVTLRVRTLAPDHIIQNLERYGYAVTDAGEHRSPDAEILSERIAGLQALLNV